MISSSSKSASSNSTPWSQSYAPYRLLFLPAVRLLPSLSCRVQTQLTCSLLHAVLPGAKAEQLTGQLAVSGEGVLQSNQLQLQSFIQTVSWLTPLPVIDASFSVPAHNCTMAVQVHSALAAQTRKKPIHKTSKQKRK